MTYTGLALTGTDSSVSDKKGSYFPYPQGAVRLSLFLFGGNFGGVFVRASNVLLFVYFIFPIVMHVPLTHVLCVVSGFLSKVFGFVFQGVFML